ncbi:GNAT family N-acetyltransferase [Brevibacterium litoralis]|uniref:GNAT family N-acetyltransferase n=1 Tax=Brevibacterium litoralis TaxID=3138935 RepID=UPI0032EC149D
MPSQDPASSPATQEGAPVDTPRVPVVGTRVVVRYTEGGTPTDALGTVVEAGADTVTVTTKRGPVTIDLSTVQLVHELPPAPTKAGPLHRIVSAEDLQRIAANTWLPADTTWLNADNLRAEAREDDRDLVQSGWLLRANGGVTHRANSALPLGDPGMPPQQALDLVTAWFTERGQKPAFLVHSAAGTQDLAPACAAVAGHFRDAGLVPSRPTLVLTAATREVSAGADRPSEAALPGLEIVEHEEPHALHFEAWGHPEGSAGHEGFRTLVTGPESHRFFSAVARHPDGSKTLVGVVRLAVSQKWAVISDLVVAPGVRRRGAGRALVRAAAAGASVRGVRSALVQVEATNEASLGLMTSLGFSEHHRYWHAVVKA